MDNNSTPIAEKVKTLEDAVEHLLPMFAGMEGVVEKYDSEGFSAFCHSMISGGISMKIRNMFGFWSQDTDLYFHMRDVHGCSHPDDMSWKITDEIYKRLKK